jgi:ribonucleotide reductase alpha subunit
LVRIATPVVVHHIHGRCMENRNMEQVKDPIVLQLELEYKFLKTELEKENNKFELIRKQHARTVGQLADDITRKFFECQAAKIEAQRYLKQKQQETINE